jgi:hypothetical protein
MSDRVMGFTVALNGDLKDEDARYIADAIRLLRGVQSVTGLLSSPTDYINRTLYGRGVTAVWLGWLIGEM